jgi:hypothetical protein
MPLLLGIPSLVIVALLFDLDVTYRLWCKCFDVFFFPLLVLRSYYTMCFRTSSTWSMYNFLNICQFCFISILLK